MSPSGGFRGWPPEAFDFYARLEADNSKRFWEANRPVYEEAVKAPFAALSTVVAGEFGPLRLFRPYRDVRFSKDKTPYKTQAGAVTEGESGAIYYVALSAEGLFVGSGHHHMAADQLERFRTALDDDRAGAEIVGIVDALRRARLEIGAMETLKTAPRGYPKDHPRIELLRMKGLTAGRSLDLAKWMHTAGAAKRVTDVWRAAEPMNDWLGRHVGPSTLAPPEPD